MFALSNSANTQPLYSNNSNNDITHNKKSDRSATKFTPDQPTPIDSKPLGFRSILKAGAVLAASYYVGSANGFTLSGGSNQIALTTPKDLQENITSLGMNPNTTTRSESQISDTILSDQWLKETFKEHQAEYEHNRSKRSISSNEQGPCDPIRDKLVALWDKRNEHCVEHWDKDKCDEAKVEWSRGDAKYNLELLACRDKCPTKKVYIVNKTNKDFKTEIKAIVGSTMEKEYIYGTKNQLHSNKNCTFTMEALKDGQYAADMDKEWTTFTLNSTDKRTTMIEIYNLGEHTRVKTEVLKETPTEFWGEVDCGMTRSEEQYKKHGKKSQDCVSL